MGGGAPCSCPPPTPCCMRGVSHHTRHVRRVAVGPFAVPCAVRMLGIFAFISLCLFAPCRSRLLAERVSRTPKCKNDFLRFSPGLRVCAVSPCAHAVRRRAESPRSCAVPGRYISYRGGRPLLALTVFHVDTLILIRLSQLIRALIICII